MRIGIRADGNSKIGTGHINRCIAVAKQLQKEGCRVFFYITDEYYYEKIISSNIKCKCINGKWDDFSCDLNDFITLIRKDEINYLLLDNYYVDDLSVGAVASVTRVAYIDDLRLGFKNCDMLINYDIANERFDYSGYEGSDILLLMGSRYVPLREEFQMIKRTAVRDEVKNVMITTGGTDNYHISASIIKKILADDMLKTINYHVICGKFSKDKDFFERTIKENSTITVDTNVSNMAECMCESDIVITGAGTTLFELACCGIPAICFIMADNQIDNASSFSKKCGMIVAGDVNDSLEVMIGNTVRELKRLILNKGIRKDMSDKMLGLVDGYGAGRIARAIIERAARG